MYRVFLVDDEEITLTQTAERVPWMENGFTVCGMECDPVRAVERIVQEKPEVVFSDLKMPRMDGHELMRRVREHELYPEFVMLSAYGNFEDARKFFKQEGFDYLLKPISMDEVEILLENLTRRLSAKYPANTEDEDSEPNAHECFDSLVEYLRHNFNEYQTLDKLGKQFGISSSYICSQFTNRFNTSMKCFLTKLRMDEAVRRIHDGESFKSVATACGYNDYYYFSKVFKGYFGVTPSEYKEQYDAQKP